MTRSCCSEREVSFATPPVTSGATHPTQPVITAIHIQCEFIQGGVSENARSRARSPPAPPCQIFRRVATGRSPAGISVSAHHGVAYELIAYRIRKYMHDGDDVYRIDNRSGIDGHKHLHAISYREFCRKRNMPDDTHCSDGPRSLACRQRCAK